MERFHTFVFVAGIGCFGVAFLLSMVFPWMTFGNYHGMEYKSLEQLAAVPSEDFRRLATDFPEAFAETYGEVSPESYGEALRRGRDIYVGHACWHCHSQYVRVVSNERQRWGMPNVAQDYQNALNQPHLWGTRRVGPDLALLSDRYTTDWQIAHLINPKNVVPDSVMPAYPYFFEEDGTPRRDGFALVTYLQWLGTDRSEMAR